MLRFKSAEVNDSVTSGIILDCSQVNHNIYYALFTQTALCEHMHLSGPNVPVSTTHETQYW
jgi:hypothetical protein